MASATPPAKLQQDIRKWIQVDNKIKELNEEVRKYREERNQLNEEIFEIVEEHNLRQAVIKITDGRLEFKRVKTAQPISLKYLKECLEHFIDEPEQVKTILDYIKENRETKYSDDIKRIYATAGGKGGAGGAGVGADDEDEEE